jgi:integrase
MARLRRDARLESREARARLPQTDDRNGYSRTIERGLTLLYYKGTQGGTWFVRKFEDGKYLKARLGLADDASDSNGTTILSFAEAQRKALGTSETLKPRETRRYSVADAVADYIEHLKVRAKSWRDTEVKLKAHVLPKLGSLQLGELTPEVVRRWRDALAHAIGDRGRPRRRVTAAQSRATAVQGGPGAEEAEGERRRPTGVSRGSARDGVSAGSDADAQRRGAIVGDEADRQRRRQASANRVFNCLRAALNHAWREGRVESDAPWRRVPAFRNVEAPVIRFLTADEAVRLINASDAEFRPLVRAALLTGCRYGELCALKVSDVDHDNRTLVIRHSKSGRPRHVYLTDEGAQLFEELTVGRQREALLFTHADGAPWRSSNQHRPMRDACVHAQIEPPVSFHILRHSYASLLTKAGVPLQVVASALGHADARMTEKHYAHLAPSHVAQLIRDNLPSLGGAAPPRKSRKVTRLRP